MPRFDAFLGGFNSANSFNIQSELCMNWIPEKVAVSVEGMGNDVHDKNVRCSLIRTPGLKQWITMPRAPIRGFLFAERSTGLFAGERHLYCVAGDSFFEIKEDGSTINRSTAGFAGASGVGPAGTTVGNDGKPAQIFQNPTQILIISAGKAYCDSGNGPVACVFREPLQDLIVDSTDDTILTTVIGGQFSGSDIGLTVTITDPGTGLILQTQTITGVTAGGGAVAGGPWGIAGSTGGAGYLTLGTVSYTDLTLVSPTVVDSASRPFGIDDIGLTLTITGGTGFIPGNYLIVDVVKDSGGEPTGPAILFSAAGTTGASGGTGTLDSMPFTASQGAYLDGYFFVVPSPPTQTVYFSEINDGTSWNPLDFFQKENYPDPIAALFADHQELYTFGSIDSTQLWRDVGDPNNPFANDQGAVMHIPCQAPFSVCRLGRGVAWIGGEGRRGWRRAYHSVGYNPVAVSTPGVEVQWATYDDVSDAVSYVIADQGHECWVITFPSGNATWVYDLQSGWWHQRGTWTGVTDWWDRHRVWVHCVVKWESGSEKHLGGDWENGTIYEISTQYKTDDVYHMVRRRIAPHITNENMRRFYARFEIDCDVLGNQRLFWNRLGNGRDRVWFMDVVQESETGGPVVTLGWTDNRGQTFLRASSYTLDPSVDVRLANAYLNYVDATWH